MNLFNLLSKAEDRLQDNDPVYNDKSDLVMAILRSKGILPYNRCSLNGGLHKLVSGALVAAHEAGTTVDVATRRAATIHEAGYSTKLIPYLDKMVKDNILVSQTNKAQGKMTLGALLTTYLDHCLT